MHLKMTGPLSKYTSCFGAPTFLNMYHSLGKLGRRQINIFFFIYFSQEIGFDVSCELFPVKETVDMKCQSLFSWKI